MTDEEELQARANAQYSEIAGLKLQVDALEAEVAALRKRLVVDDAMVKRADSVFWSVGGNWIDCMRAALEAALGTVGSFPTRQELSDAAAEIEKLRAERDAARDKALNNVATIIGEFRDDNADEPFYSADLSRQLHDRDALIIAAILRLKEQP